MIPSAMPPDVWSEDLTRVFLEATERAGTTAECVAHALRRAFVAEVVKVLIVEHSQAGDLVCGAAECTTLDGPPRPIASAAAETLLLELETRSPRDHWPMRLVASDIEWWVRGEDDTVFFALAWSFTADRVTIHCRLDGASEADLAAAFDQSISAIRLFASAVRSRHLLECTQKAEDLRAHFGGQLGALLHTTGTPGTERFEDLVGLLQEIAQCRHLGSREDLHCQILRLANMTFNRFVQHQGFLEPELLRDAAASLRHLSKNVSLAVATRHELELLAACIDALHSFEDPGTQIDGATEPRHQALALLAAAIRAHTQASESTDSALDGIDGLSRLVQQIRDMLPGLLVTWAAKVEPGHPGSFSRRAPGVRMWLRVWLILDLAWIDGALGENKDERSENMLALSLVLRDGIRYELYRNTPGFELDFTTLTRMMQDIVVLHAVARNESLERVGLGQHLRIMEASGFGRWNGEGHQAHVIDVYVTGNFLLDLWIDEDSPQDTRHESICALLANSGPRGEADLRAAFCLAALFHDAGMLLFPSVAHPESTPIEDLNAVKHTCALVRTQLDAMGKLLVDRCVDDLTPEKYFAPEKDWEPWLTRQQLSERPEHELLGAWYLHMACVKSENVPPEVSQAAVRATLLHGALGVEVNVDKDAAAALLILCDELCDWFPTRKPPPDRRDLGRYSSDPSVHQGLNQGRARVLDIKDLRLRVGGGRLLAGIRSSTQAPTDAGWPSTKRYWPRFEIGLHAPRELDVSLEMLIRGAQNLGRIVCPDGRWAPALKVVGVVPERLQRVRHTTRELLAQLKRDLDPTTLQLQSWLDALEQFSPVADPQAEIVYFVSEAGPELNDHVVVCMKQVMSHADKIVKSWEQRSQLRSSHPDLVSPRFDPSRSWVRVTVPPTTSRRTRLPR